MIIIEKYGQPPGEQLYDSNTMLLPLPPQVYQPERVALVVSVLSD